MTYSFCPDIHHCVSDGYSIILDVRRDRYFALSDEGHHAIQRLLRKQVNQVDEAVLERLADRSILQRSDRNETGMTPYVTPKADFRDFPASGQARWIVRAVAEQSKILVLLRLFSLRSCLARTVRQREAALAMNKPFKADAFGVAASFRASSAFVSFHDRCLAGSLALMTLMTLARYRTTLVMGVSCRPFRAHCWLEYDGIVLSDVVDHVRLFTPILVL